MNGAKDGFAVSDVHGHLRELERLLRKGGFADDEGDWVPSDRSLWFLGDYVDRGPDSLGVIDLVRRLQEQSSSTEGHVGALLGNHEVQFLAAVRFGTTPVPALQPFGIRDRRKQGRRIQGSGRGRGFPISGRIWPRATRNTSILAWHGGRSWPVTAPSDFELRRCGLEKSGSLGRAARRPNADRRDIPAACVIQVRHRPGQASEPAKICQARADFATRLRTR